MTLAVLCSPVYPGSTKMRATRWKRNIPGMSWECNWRFLCKLLVEIGGPKNCQWLIQYNYNNQSLEKHNTLKWGYKSTFDSVFNFPLLTTSTFFSLLICVQLWHSFAMGGQTSIQQHAWVDTQENTHCRITSVITNSISEPQIQTQDTKWYISK